LPVRILDQHGNPYPDASAARTKPRLSNHENELLLKARFDSQFTTDDNRRHWALADAMSIDASASWMVRRQLRMRSRYEFHNNSFYFGMVDTVADYCIGTGPRLQMLTKNKKLNRRIEKLWKDWSKEIRLAETLHTMRMARCYNGESFSLMRTNPNLSHPVKLDIFGIECDQVSSPLFGMYPAQYPDQFFDGIVLDPWGHPEKYHVLRQHPGAYGAFVVLGYEFDTWPARYVLHDYRRIRQGQQRGIPETTPALEDFAEVRRYAKAVLGAAETAADYAMTVQSDAAANADDTEVEPMDTFEIRRRMATVLPAGWKLAQTKAEQPTTTYEMFVNAKLCEISRCLNFPLMFVTLDARLANMSSAYVVTQPFAKSVKRDRELNYEPMLDRGFDEFLTEAIRIPGLIVDSIDELPDELPHAWQWPKIGNHADPAKVATGRMTSLSGGFGSIPQFCAEDGDDWEEVQEQNAKSLGMSLDDYRAALRQRVFATPGAPAPASLEDEPDPVPPDAGPPVKRGNYADDDDDGAEAVRVTTTPVAALRRLSFTH
jgi:capsid protein